MGLEIIGNTLNGRRKGDYATEILNVWTTSEAETDGFVNNSAVVDAGYIYASCTAENQSKNIISPDLLPLLSRNYISFYAHASVSAPAADTSTNDGYTMGWNGTAYIRLTDGSGNNQNLVYATALATTTVVAGAAAAGAYSSGIFNISLDGNILTIKRGGQSFNYTHNNGSHNSVSSSKTLITDGTTVDISSWSSLKIQVVASAADFRSSGGDPGWSIASMSPIIIMNSKLGSNKTQ